MKLRNLYRGAVRCIALLIVGGLLAPLAVRPSYSQTQNIRLRVHGAVADALSCETPGPFGPLCIYVRFGRDRSTNESATFLLVEGYLPAPDGGFVAVFGSGLVPEEDLVGDVPGQAIPRGLRLNTSVTNNQGEISPQDGGFRFDPFFTQKCSPGFPPVCTATQLTGNIEVSVDATGLVTGSQQGTSTTRIRLGDGSFLNSHQVGTSQGGSASATLSLFGIPLSVLRDASIGTGNSMEITIEKTSN